MKKLIVYLVLMFVIMVSPVYSLSQREENFLEKFPVIGEVWESRVEGEDDTGMKNYLRSVINGYYEIKNSISGQNVIFGYRIRLYTENNQVEFDLTEDEQETIINYQEYTSNTTDNYSGMRAFVYELIQKGKTRKLPVRRVIEEDYDDIQSMLIYDLSRSDRGQHIIVVYLNLNEYENKNPTLTVDRIEHLRNPLKGLVD